MPYLSPCNTRPRRPRDFSLCSRPLTDSAPIRVDLCRESLPKSHGNFTSFTRAPAYHYSGQIAAHLRIRVSCRSRRVWRNEITSDCIGSFDDEMKLRSFLPLFFVLRLRPGYPGYYQVNFRVPDGISPGAAISVRLTYVGRPSNEVTIAAQ